MRMPTFSKHQHGVGLLEVLIAVAVLSIALLSLGGLHTLIIQSSSAAKARATAASLAQEKLDDLRAFQQIAAGGNGTFGYSEIAANAGGEENADGTLQIPSGAVTISSIAYSRTWTVREFSYCGENVAPTEDTDLADGNNACGTSGVPADFKLIAMTVSWTDREGAQQMLLTAAVQAMDPTSVGQSSIVGTSGKPIVLYNPGVAPDVIPISLDGTTKKEATKPQPDTTTHKHSTLTTFDEITYNTALKTSVRDAFFTVNCVCQQNGANNGSDPKGVTPTIFDGDEYIVGIEHNTKHTGSTYRSGQFNEQPPVCDICCRDHHDSITSTTLADTDESCTDNPNQSKCVYDPFRRSADYNAGIGDHNHYYDGNNDGNLELANLEGDLYYEACRMVRVGGILRVLQDWRLEALQVVPGSYLQSTTNINSYASYVSTFVQEYIKGISSAYPATTPDLSANTAVTTAAAAFAFGPTGTEPTGPHEMEIADSENFIARGVFMDYMSAELVNLLKCKINGSGTDCTGIPVDSGYLNFVPFHEVNLTRLSTWSKTDAPTDGAGQVVTVTSEPIEQGTETTYSRGRVVAVESGSATVTATIEISNTGLTDSKALDDATIETPSSSANDDRRTIADTVNIVVLSAGTPPTNISVSGTISTDGNTSRNESNIVITGTLPTICSRDDDLNYHCVLGTSPASGTIVISNYNATNNNGTIKDNCALDNSGTRVGTVSNSGLITETTTFSFSGETSNVPLNIRIRSGNSC